jgi:hypothetical protein
MDLKFMLSDYFGDLKQECGVFCSVRAEFI